MFFTGWFGRRSGDDDLEEEIRAHLALAAQERTDEGMDAEEARYAAVRELGNLTRTIEDTRRVWTPGWLEVARDWFGDVRYAVRALARHPAFALTVVAVLTVGIGLNAAVFTMLKGFTLSPIAGVAHSAAIAVIHGETTAGRDVRLSYPCYLHLRDHHTGFEDLFGTIPATVTLGRGRAARQIWGELVTGNYFRALGVQAQLGRTLLPSDEIAPGPHPVVVISDAFWRREYGADRGVIGRTIDINNNPLTVVGVLDDAFHGTVVSYDVEVFVPILTAPQLGFAFGSAETTAAAILADRQTQVFAPHGYLRHGVSLAAATAQADALWAARSTGTPDAEGAQHLRVVRFWQAPGTAPAIILPTLFVLSGMGLLVLVIACANVAGLVAVRGLSRRGEIAVRLALGASRRRVVRLLVVENLLLAAPAAVLGLLLAMWLLPLMVGFAERLAAPDRLFFNVAVDGWVLAFVVLAGCGSALLIGLLPAVRGARVDLVTAIAEDAAPRGTGRGRARATLVVAQVAVSVMLLVGSGLATRSVQAARGADPGFTTAQVAVITLDLKQNGYDGARGLAFYRQLLETVRADPQVESATLAAYVPLAFLDRRPQPIAVAGYVPRPEDDLAVMSNVIAPGYFETLRVPLLAGRGFTSHDTAAGSPVIVVNRTFAERFLGGAPQALGGRVRIAGGPWREVVGVAADLKYSRVDEAPRPYVYLPHEQAYRSGMVLHVRSPLAMDRLLDRARDHIASLDPELPVFTATSLEHETRGALIFYDLTAAALSIFGIAGLALAAIGTYGLVSFAVRHSTREIGTRVALGASGMTIARSFVARGLRLGALGAVIGAGAALVLGSLLERVLFGVAATDLPSFVRALVVVLGGVVLASLVPACRGARIDPLRALRHH